MQLRERIGRHFYKKQIYICNASTHMQNKHHMENYTSSSQQHHLSKQKKAEKNYAQPHIIMRLISVHIAVKHQLNQTNTNKQTRPCFCWKNFSLKKDDANKSLPLVHQHTQHISIADLNYSARILLIFANKHTYNATK